MNRETGEYRSEKQPLHFKDIYLQTVTTIYRFHLGVTGDPITAEGLTAATFQTARAWMSDQYSDIDHYNKWLLEIASKTHKNGRDLHLPTALAELDGTEDMELSRIQQVRAADLAAQIHNLPHIQAAVLSLYLFAGQEPDAISAIMEINLARINRMLDQALLRLGVFSPPQRISTENSIGFYAQDLSAAACGEDSQSSLDELRRLVSNVTPRQGFVSALFAALDKSPQRARGIGSTWEEHMHWKHSIPGFGLVVVAILIAGIFKFGLWPPNFSSSNRNSPATPQRKVSPQSVLGYLVPPDEKTCLAWQEQLNQITGIKFSLQLSAAFSEPANPVEAHNGRGCELTASVDGMKVVSYQHAIDQITPLFTNQGYTQEDIYHPVNICAECFPLRGDRFGEMVTFNSPIGRALLTASWRPLDAQLCSSSIKESDCNPSLPLRIYTLRVNLASDPARETLKAFLAAWQSNDPKTIGFLSTQLRSHIPDVTKLDQLTGIEQDTFNLPNIVWNLNSVQANLVKLDVDVLSRAAAQGTDTAQVRRLGVVLGENKDNTWAVEDIWMADGLPTHDFVVAADEDRRLVEISVDDGSITPLTDTGFYTPPESTLLGMPRPEAELSPDGRWLAISMPIATPADARGDPTGGTWLVSMGGSGAHLLDSQPVHVAWSPDSQQIAYTSPLDMSSLYVVSPDGGGAKKMASLDGTIQTLAWSMQGDWIGITWSPSGTNSSSGFLYGGYGLHVERVDAQTGHLENIGNIPAAIYASAYRQSSDLQWSKDGLQLWVNHSNTEFDLGSGQVHPAVAQPAYFDLLLHQAWVQPSYSDIMTGPLIEQVSPDGQEFASVIPDKISSNKVNISIQSFTPLADQPITQEWDAISAIDWTGNASALVIAGGVKTSGPVWRMDSHSGDIQTLVQNAYYIGLHSSMLRESLRLAPQISLTPLPAPESQDQWTTVDIPSAQISLKSPAGWKIMPPVANSVWSALSSVDFSEGYGLAALDADQMVIYISRQPSYGSPDDYLQHRFKSQNRGQGAWQTMDLNGATAYIQMVNVSQASPQTVLIPSSGGIVTIVKYPFSSVYDPIFIQILKTIQLK